MYQITLKRMIRVSDGLIWLNKLQKALSERTSGKAFTRQMVEEPNISKKRCRPTPNVVLIPYVSLDNTEIPST
jgi:hypothetical protein